MITKHISNLTEKNDQENKILYVASLNETCNKELIKIHTILLFFLRRPRRHKRVREHCFPRFRPVSFYQQTLYAHNRKTIVVRHIIPSSAASLTVALV